ncbi:MAG: protein translocase subunit SecD [Chloroflexi bacterium]|nr:MAG: protein translocase subunit SecD [Chloroflexota bacterium]
MRDRTPYWFLFIVILTALALWIDLPVQHPQWLNDFLLWQPQEARDNNRRLGLDPVRTHLGLDLQGGLQVLLEADLPPDQTLSEGAMETARQIIERRVNGLGLAEPLVQLQGERRIIVELPGVANPDEAIALIRETGLLEFVNAGPTFVPPGTRVRTTYETGEADTGSAEGAVPAAEVQATPTLTATTPITGSETATPTMTAPSPALTTTTPVTGGEGLTATEAITPTEPALPLLETVMTGAALQDAQVVRNPRTGEIEVAFQIRPEKADFFEQFTGSHINQYLCIVLDKEVISCPVIRNAIRENGVIQGKFTLAEARNLALQLRYGALPVPLRIETVRSIGATLGEDSIRKSIQAGIIGVLVVLAFMLIYYRFPGSLADLALIIYALLNLAIFKLLPVTMTLPGITGFLLSTGMAVDANILIFERMKEELRWGRSLRMAIEAGFDRAWTSIRDSNLSTIITSLILYWFGTNFGASAVKGFAITLVLGVLISMFTAVIVTRTFLRLVFHRVQSWLEEHPWLLGV